MTIECNQFDNIRFVVFGKFCFEETKRSHTKTTNEKRKKNWLKILKNLFQYRNTQKRFFLFLYFKQKRNETKFFFRGAIKNELFDHKKNETLTSLVSIRSLSAHHCEQCWARATFFSLRHRDVRHLLNHCATAPLRCFFS